MGLARHELALGVRVNARALQDLSSKDSLFLGVELHLGGGSLSGLLVRVSEVNDTLDHLTGASSVVTVNFLDLNVLSLKTLLGLSVKDSLELLFGGARDVSTLSALVGTGAADLLSHHLSFLSGIELEGQLALGLGLLSLDIGLGLNKLCRESLQGLNAFIQFGHNYS